MNSSMTIDSQGIIFGTLQKSEFFFIYFFTPDAIRGNKHNMWVRSKHKVRRQELGTSLKVTYWKVILVCWCVVLLRRFL